MTALDTVQGVFWMRRPPYLRWLAAAAVLVVALAFELSDRRSTPHPFAVRDIAAGATITNGDIEWRPVPAHLLPLPDLTNPVAAHDVSRGEPLRPSDVASSSLVPPGWWSLPLVLPQSAVPGVAVRIVVLDEPMAAVEGIVVAAGESNAFSIADAGLVAVPESHADAIAAAAAADRVMILLRP